MGFAVHVKKCATGARMSLWTANPCQGASMQESMCLCLSHGPPGSVTVLKLYGQPLAHPPQPVPLAPPPTSRLGSLVGSQSFGTFGRRVSSARSSGTKADFKESSWAFGVREYRRRCATGARMSLWTANPCQRRSHARMHVPLVYCTRLHLSLTVSG